MGRPIAIDACTEALLKGAFAHVYVEINVSKLLVSGVSLGPPKEFGWQEFLFENVGIFCFCSGILGHCSSNSLLANSFSKHKVAVIMGGGDAYDVSIVDDNTYSGIIAEGGHPLLFCRNPLMQWWILNSRKERRSRVRRLRALASGAGEVEAEEGYY